MFSSTIKISSVSDYITPSQECVKPLMKNLKMQIEDPTINMKPNLIKTQNNVARVTLQDCLACSGCVTTAETILIEAHSLKEFLTSIQKHSKPAIGISQQSRVSLAHQFDMNDYEMHNLLYQMFMSLNVKLYDLSEYTQIALNHSLIEFKERQINPILCSECPGWICYAEKTLDQFIINHLSKIKSPQQIFGQIQRQNHDYIATIMPCYDKKLEAVREENTNEIDIVLSTREVEELVKDFILKKEAIQQSIQLTTIVPQIQDFSNPSSNSYLDFIIQEIIKENWIVKSNIRKNKDFLEIFVYDQNMVLQYSFARVYGLKNIANLITQLKSKTCKYQYVEIMACPQGCLNGGGQIQIQKNTEKSLDLIPKLRNLLLKDKIKFDKDNNQIEQQNFKTTFKHIENVNNFQW